MSDANAALISRCLMDWEATYVAIADEYEFANEVDGATIRIPASEVEDPTYANIVIGAVTALASRRSSG